MKKMSRQRRIDRYSWGKGANDALNVMLALFSAPVSKLVEVRDYVDSLQRDHEGEKQPLNIRVGKRVLEEIARELYKDERRERGNHQTYNQLSQEEEKYRVRVRKYIAGLQRKRNNP
jgi:hypothetical protein